MYCIYCGRLGDFHETYACDECRLKIEKNNERVRLIVLLSEAYPFVSDMRLRQKIEAVIFPTTKPK